MESREVFLVICPPFPTKLPPLGLAYLAEYLEQKGVKVACFDLNINFFDQAADIYKKSWNIQNNPDFASFVTKCFINNNNPVINSLFNEIDIKRPEIIGFSCFKSNYYPTFKIIKMIKKRYKNIKILCGGPEIGALKSQKGENWLKGTGIDAIIIGEGEKACFKIVHNQFTSNKLIVIDKDQEDMLDAIPFPSFSQFERNPYGIRTQLPIIMSRGCIRSCSFCSERLLFNGYRTRSAKHVFNEIITHMTKGICSFVFYDSLINGNLVVLEEFCDLIITQGLRIAWEAQCIIRNDMSEALLSKMRKAGCFNLFIGLEAASNTVLRRMNKGITLSDAKAFFEKCRMARLHFEISLITAFPQETEEEFEATCSFLRNNRNIIPKIAQVNSYIPYEGTSAATIDFHINKSIGAARVRRLVELFIEEKIPYTKSFIGNLLPSGKEHDL